MTDMTLFFKALTLFREKMILLLPSFISAPLSKCSHSTGNAYGEVSLLHLSSRCHLLAAGGTAHAKEICLLQGGIESSGKDFSRASVKRESGGGGGGGGGGGKVGFRGESSLLV